MKSITMAAAMILALAAGSSVTPAQAAGCLKGAVVGGVAGHLAGHHGLIGAGVGCAVGHHEAAKRAREQTQHNRNSYSHSQADYNSR